MAKTKQAKKPSPADPLANAIAARQAAAAGTKAAGRAVSAAVSRAKVPLIVGGSAIAGATATFAANSRHSSRSKSRFSRLIGR
jgi:hypothetical protein